MPFQSVPSFLQQRCCVFQPATAAVHGLRADHPHFGGLTPGFWTGSRSWTLMFQRFQCHAISESEMFDIYIYINVVYTFIYIKYIYIYHDIHILLQYNIDTSHYHYSPLLMSAFSSWVSVQWSVDPMANHWDEEKLDPKFEDPTESTEGLARLRKNVLDGRSCGSANYGKNPMRNG